MGSYSESAGAHQRDNLRSADPLGLCNLSSGFPSSAYSRNLSLVSSLWVPNLEVS